MINEEKEKSSTKKRSSKEKATLALMIVAIIVSLGACDYIVWDKVFNKKECVSSIRERVVYRYPTLNPPNDNDSSIPDDINEDKEESPNAKDEAKHGDEEEVDTSKMPVIDGEKGSSAMNGGLGFLFAAKNSNGGRYYVTKSGNVYYVPRFVTPPVNGKSEVYTNIKFDDKYLPGTYGKYSLKYDNFSSMSNESASKDSFTIVGYKLDLKNIIDVNDIGAGQQGPVGDLVAFIDKDGNISIFYSSPVFDSNSEWAYDYKRGRAQLTKNLKDYKNVASVGIRFGLNGVYTMVTFRDGTQKKLNNDYIKNALQ